jgi:protein TonB
MRQSKFVISATLVASVIIAGCATTQESAQPVTQEMPVGAKSAMPREAAAPAAPVKAAQARVQSSAHSVDAYKKDVANRILAKNAELSADRLPPILKSVVVLDITVDRDGNPVNVSVFRGNGHKELEQVALASVRKAGPFPAPSAEVLKGQNTVRFVETFLFRPDGRYQVRSIAEVQNLDTSSAVAKKK